MTTLSGGDASKLTRWSGRVRLGTPAAKEENAAAEEGDAAFRGLLARVNLAPARYALWRRSCAEFNSVQAAITALEKVEEQVHTLADDTARLAAHQESLRRSL